MYAHDVSYVNFAAKLETKSKNGHSYFTAKFENGHAYSINCFLSSKGFSQGAY